jgi:hypothetical protein
VPLDPEQQALADRTYRYAPPSWRIFDALTTEIEEWVILREREVQPTVLEAVRPTSVLWSSIWPVSAGDRIRFSIESDSEGSTVRFVWTTPSPPDDRGVGIVRYRLNQLIGGDLRLWVDSQVRPTR